MEKPKFQNVSLDYYTFELLNELAKGVKLTKAAYLRTLIRTEAAKRQGKGEAMPVGVPAIASITAEFDQEMVVKHGVWMAMADLSLFEQVATRIAKRFNVTIDVEKWKRQLIGDAEPKNTEELV